MQNIEFKAELRDIEAAAAKCRTLGADCIGTVEQTDEYFRLSDGRLKRRSAPGEPSEWIFYHRPNHVRPRMSSYTILSDEQAARRWGTHSLRAWLTVRKKRELWMLSNVRIHLDVVEDLGTFIEFEAMVSKLHDVKACHRAAERLREEFGPVLGEPISHSYSDLMELHLEAQESADG
jgi:adenylate cyclase class IV